MAEVPDHLRPEDGLSDSNIRFDSFRVLHDTDAAEVTFGLYDEDGHHVGNFDIVVRSQAGGVRDVIAEAHRQMTEYP